MKLTYSMLGDFAETLDLCVDRYKLSGKLKIKIFEFDHFEGDGLGQFNSVREAYAFLLGYQQAMFHKHTSNFKGV